MDDRSILARINEMVDEEHQLRNAVQAGQITTEQEHARLRELEESLDQYWDLLRRRRFARRSGEDPDATRPRDRGEVERYLQ